MELASGGTSFDFFFLAMAHWQRDKKNEAQEWYEKAVAWMEKNRPDNDDLIRFRAEAEKLLEIPAKTPLPPAVAPKPLQKEQEPPDQLQ